MVPSISLKSLTSVICLHTVQLSKSSISNNLMWNKSKINGFKYSYVSLKIQLNISHVSTQLNDQTNFKQPNLALVICFHSV